MPQLSISLFGSIDVNLGGEPVKRFRSDKVLALLIYLSVEAHRPHRREALAGLLWPDQPERVARHNLSQSLLRLRQAINDAAADPSFLLVSRQEIQFNQAADYQLDVADFLAPLSTDADDASPASGNISAELHPYRQAARQYRGDFLAQFSLPDSDLFEEWMLAKREHLRQQALMLLNRLIAWYDERAEYDSAHHYAWQLVDLDPLDEEAHCILMRLLALSGQRSAALSQFDSLGRILEEELAAEPSEETMALVEQIRSGELSNSVQEQRRSSENLAPTPQRLNASSQVPDTIVTLSRLDAPLVENLFGVAENRATLTTALEAETSPWLVALDGIGGIGKTTMANSLVHAFVESDRFYDIGWVSAKQEEFLPEVGTRDTGRAALDADTLTDALLDQLSDQPYFSASPQEKRMTLTRILKAHPYLIVVDNLESVADSETLLPYLRQLAQPTKFLLTTRFSLKAHFDIFCLSLSELSQPDTLAFLKHEAETRGIVPLTNATNDQLENIYHVVGGNPLALKLVIGQLSFLPLSQVLENLIEAQGKRIDALYTYIYWQAWEMLDEVGRQLFLTMPIIPNGTFSQLATASELDLDDLQTAVTHLIALSLVQISGDLDAPRYRLHRLTETFLMNEVFKWQSGF